MAKGRFNFKQIEIGELAQLVERLHGMQEVTGSNPVFSTTKYLKLTAVAFFVIFNGLS